MLLNQTHLHFHVLAALIFTLSSGGTVRAFAKASSALNSMANPEALCSMRNTLAPKYISGRGNACPASTLRSVGEGEATLQGRPLGHLARVAASEMGPSDATMFQPLTSMCLSSFASITGRRCERMAIWVRHVTFSCSSHNAASR